MMNYTLTNYTLKGHGTYQVTIADKHGKSYTVLTHDMELIDAVKEAGRQPAVNDDGSYQRACAALVAHVVGRLGL